MSSQSQVSSLQKQVNTKLDQYLSSNDESARLDALETTHKLSQALEKPANAVFKWSLTPTLHLAIKLGHDLDVFTTLTKSDHGSTIDQLAAPKKADPVFVERIMRALVITGFAEQLHSTLYGSTNLSLEMTRKKSSNCMDMLFHDLLPPISQSPEFFQKTNYQDLKDSSKGPFQLAFGTSVDAFNYLSQNPEALTRFHLFMEAARGNNLHWADWCPVQQQILDGASTDEERVLLVDVGGGKGSDIEYFMKRFSGVPGRYILEDVPAVIDDIHGGLDGRIERVKQDFWTPQLVKGARAYYMKSILHDWTDEQCEVILRHIGAAMEKGYSKLFIQEFILPEDNSRLLPILYDMIVMAYCAGRERTRSGWTNLLNRAGFEIKGVWQSGGEGQGIIEAELG